MTRYRRLYRPGGTYFFTVTLANRGARTLVEEADLLCAAWRAVAAEHPFTTEAAVILPDHLHAVWTLPEGDADFSTRWMKIKAGFTKGCRAKGQPRPSHRRRREAGLWQRRFWEHLVRYEEDLAAHVAYCWWNPVKHGLVERPEDWPWSSFHRDRRMGRA